MFVILGIVLLLSSGMQGFTENWIVQKLDHFLSESNLDNKTLKQQYFTDSNHFRAGGEIWIQLSGEWDVTNKPGDLKHKSFYEESKNHGGFFVAPEHRFYGQSLPYPCQLNQMKYLSVQQSLEDLGDLIDHIKSTVPGLANAEIIFNGYNYDEALLTWLDERYQCQGVSYWNLEKYVEDSIINLDKYSKTVDGTYHDIINNVKEITANNEKKYFTIGNSVLKSPFDLTLDDKMRIYCEKHKVNPCPFFKKH